MTSTRHRSTARRPKTGKPPRPAEAVGLTRLGAARWQAGRNTGDFK